MGWGGGNCRKRRRRHTGGRGRQYCRHGGGRAAVRPGATDPTATGRTPGGVTVYLVRGAITPGPVTTNGVVEGGKWCWLRRCGSHSFYRRANGTRSLRVFLLFSCWFFFLYTSVLYGCLVYTFPGRSRLIYGSREVSANTRIRAEAVLYNIQGDWFHCEPTRFTRDFVLFLFLPGLSTFFGPGNMNQIGPRTKHHDGKS